MKQFCVVLCVLACATAALGSCGPLCTLDLPGIIAYQGYPVEHHSVVPADKTVTLNMYRIPGPRGSSLEDATAQRRPPVLLQHGLLDSGTTWIVNPTNESLGFILADQGFDVWIGNNRGNTYSPCKTDECWKFSYDQMALFDLPAMIDYISNYTGFPNISYVGHSEGTTQAFAGFATIPTLAEKVNVFVALAPAVWVNNQRSILVTALVDLDVDQLFVLFGDKEFLPESWFLKTIAKLFCNGGIITPLCSDVIFALCGDDPSKNHDLNQTREEVYLTHTPAGTSVQNMVHWAQAVKSTKFQMFDYGLLGNFAHYGQSSPPVYDLSKFSVPTALFSGGHDDLADPTDVEYLFTQLPANIQVFRQYIEKYEHLDFVWAMDAASVIYPNVILQLEKYAPIPPVP